MPTKEQGQADPPALDASLRLPVILPVLIVLSGCLAYATSFSGVFLFDDIPGIVNYPVIRDWSRLFEMLDSRRPLVTLSLALNYSLGALEPLGYHLFNLLVHLLAALALFGVVRRTLHLARFPAWVHERSNILACVSAILWVVHPLNTQSVTYIIQRGESMMSLFYLLTLYCVIRGATKKEGANWFALATVACGAGMACKGVMVTAPVVVLLFDRLFLSSSLVEALRRRWILYVALASTWAVLFFAGIISAILPADGAYSYPATVGFKTPGVEPLEYLLTQGRVILHYIRLSIAPFGQSLDPEWTIVARLAPIEVASLLVVAGLLLLTLWGTVRRHPWSFIGVWFFGILAPTSSFVPIRDAAFEHRMYLPLAGIVVGACLLVAWSAHRLAAKSVSMERRAGRAAAFAAIGAVVGLTAITLGRNTVYSDRLVMWQDVIDKNPNAVRARINAGQELVARGQYPEAEEKLRRATEIRPNYPDAHLELGFALVGQGRIDEARSSFGRAMDIGLLGGAALYGTVGGRLNVAGLPDVAERAFARAVELQPDNPLWNYWYGATIASQGDYARALAYLEQARRLYPEFPATYWTLGLAHEMVGSTDVAATWYAKSIELAPETLQAYVQLANYHSEANRHAQSVEILAQMLSRDIPESEFATARIAWFNRANSYFSLGKFHDAVECYEGSLALEPTHMPSLIGMARAYFQLNLLDEALEICRDARALEPNNLDVLGLYRQISIERRKQMLVTPEEIEEAISR